MPEAETSSLESRVAALTAAEVAPMVRGALGGEALTPTTWQIERLNRTYGTMTGGIFRLRGMAETAGETRPWSLILKVVSPAAWEAMLGGPQDDLDHPLYWKREVLVYQSGWLDCLPGGIRGPRCYALQEQPDRSVWLWLEEARDHYRGDWPVAQFTRAARCLGRFNGAYLAREPWPSHAWLLRTGSPRGVIEAFNWIEPIVRDPNVWAHPLLRAAFPQSLFERLPAFWERRHALLDGLERLPQTVCHQDAWVGNAFSPYGTDGELVLIDWAYVGSTVVGSDLADLAVAGYPLLASAPAPADIDAAVFDAYYEGLREAGWAAPRDMVRFGYITCAALKYGCLLPWLRDIADETRLAVWERLAGQPAPAWLQKQACVLQHQLRLLDEASALLPTL